MTVRVSIRAGRPSDAAAVARVHVETWRTTYAGIIPDAYLVGMTEAGQERQWRRHLQPGSGERVLIAQAGRRLVGFGSCGPGRTKPARRLEGGLMGEIYTLYVAPDFQGQGIGGRLLTGLFSRLHEAGRETAVVWVLSANPARFFYETMGGNRIAERRENFAGTELEETAYAWLDLGAWLAARRGAARRR